MPALVSITIEPPDATIVDDTFLQLVAFGHFDDADIRALLYGEVVFDSSDPDVLTAHNSKTIHGRCFGKSPGTVTVTATADGITATADITVTAHSTYTHPDARFSIGFGSSVFNPYPLWESIDEHPNLVTSYTIDRGRSYELDQFDAGRATVNIADPDGILDPTNPDGPYYGQIRPLLPATICNRSPVTGSWANRFRGFIENYAYEVDPSQRLNRLVISLVDLFEIVSSVELQPAFTGDDNTGKVKYPEQLPDERIAQVLNQIGMPDRMAVLLQGHVHVRKSTYSPTESALAAIQEAADAEFPGIGNVFCDRRGRLCFRGRTARFDPGGVASAAGDERWDYHHWLAGDGAAIEALTFPLAQIRGFQFERGLSKIINTATATPAGTPDSKLDDQTITDNASIFTYGVRSWSANDLLTIKGDLSETHPTGALTETRRFADFYVSNYAQPRDRISQITLRSIHPDDPRAPATWDLLHQVDIGDTISLHIMGRSPAGFFSEDYFVEGIHEDVRPLDPAYDDITLTLDLSPRALYAVDPWEDALTAADADDPEDITREHPHQRGGKPKPVGHARDHEHDGADPIATHYENVGDDSGGAAVNLTGYLHYSTAGGDVLGQNVGDTVTIQTTGSNGLILLPAYGDGLRIYPSGNTVSPMMIYGRPGGTPKLLFSITSDGRINLTGDVYIQGLSLEDYINLVVS